MGIWKGGKEPQRDIPGKHEHEHATPPFFRSRDASNAPPNIQQHSPTTPGPRFEYSSIRVFTGKSLTSPSAHSGNSNKARSSYARVRQKVLMIKKMGVVCIGNPAQILYYLQGTIDGEISISESCFRVKTSGIWNLDSI